MGKEEMVYDDSFEYNGEIIKYILVRSSFKYPHTDKFEEDPKISAFINLYFENGDMIPMRVHTNQSNLTTLLPTFVKDEYIKFLKEQEKYK